MRRPAQRVARLLHALFHGPHPAESRGESRPHDQGAAEWVQIYYQPGGVGPRRVLSVRADALYDRPMIRVVEHSDDRRLTLLQA